jgi:hypothetical protein
VDVDKCCVQDTGEETVMYRIHTEILTKPTRINNTYQRTNMSR